MRPTLILASMFLVLAAVGSGKAAPGAPGHRHEGYSAGEPGDPKKVARVVLVIMREGDGKMIFSPDRIDVRKGEQIRFILRNNGQLEHEFVLATAEENARHADQMRKNPDMEHDDPNGKRIKPKGTSEIVWRFTKSGEFQFACLIPGHSEAGMVGTVVVK